MLSSDRPGELECSPGAVVYSYVICYISSVVCRVKLEDLLFPNIFHSTVVLLTFYHIKTVRRITVQELVYLPFTVIFSD